MKIIKVMWEIRDSIVKENSLTAKDTLDITYFKF